MSRPHRPRLDTHGGGAATPSGPVDAPTLDEALSSSSPPRVIDVRTPAEFETVHLPGAVNVPLDTLREHRPELTGALGDVVIVCRSGQRAARAETLLAEAGVVGARVLDGGVAAWEAAGLPVRRGRPRWDIERQVRLVAGTLVLTGVAGSVVAPRMKWLSAGIGGGLAIAALTDSCLMGSLLSRLPYNRTAPRDPATIIAELTRDR